MVPFSSLKLNEKFTYNGMTWIKVVPVKKNCCKMLYNAHVDGNVDIRQVFQPGAEVEKIE